jgi:hypothetical protein
VGIEFFEALSLESYCKKAIVRLFAATVTLSWCQQETSKALSPAAESDKSLP